MPQNLHRMMKSISALVEQFGLPLALLAWFTVFFSALAMALVLQRQERNRKHFFIARVIGFLSLGAHLADYAITLHISPNLELESNPLWRIVIDGLGLSLAKGYGLSGKVLLSILGYQCAYFYLCSRERLYPDSADTLTEFWRRFGRPEGVITKIAWRNMANFFAFCFALMGPFYYYIALQNAFVESPLHRKFPPLPLILLGYIGLMVTAYFLLTYRSFRRKRNSW